MREKCHACKHAAKWTSQTTNDAMRGRHENWNINASKSHKSRAHRPRQIHRTAANGYKRADVNRFDNLHNRHARHVKIKTWIADTTKFEARIAIRRVLAKIRQIILIIALIWNYFALFIRKAIVLRINIMSWKSHLHPEFLTNFAKKLRIGQS